MRYGYRLTHPTNVQIKIVRNIALAIAFFHFLYSAKEVRELLTIDKIDRVDLLIAHFTVILQHTTSNAVEQRGRVWRLMQPLLAI